MLNRQRRLYGRFAGLLPRAAMQVCTYVCMWFDVDIDVSCGVLQCCSAVKGAVHDVCVRMGGVRVKEAHVVCTPPLFEWSTAMAVGLLVKMTSEPVRARTWMDCPFGMQSGKATWQAVSFVLQTVVVSALPVPWRERSCACVE